MERQFSFNIILLILVNILIKPLYIFGIEIPVQNIVGNESYGVYFAFLNLTYLFQIINDPGVQNYNSKEIAANPVWMRRFFPQIIFLKGGLAMLFILATGMVAWLLGYWDIDPVLLGLVMCAQILVSYVQFIRTNVAAKGKYSIDSLLSVGDKLLMILALGSMIWLSDTPDLSMRTFVLIQIASFVIVALTGVTILRHDLDKLVWTWNKAVNRKVIKNSLPQALVIFLMFLYTRTDGVMIEALLEDGSYQAGIYAAAFRIMDAFTMFTFLFAALLVPMFSKLLKSGDPIEPLYYRALHWIVAIAMVAAISVFVYSDQWMDLLYEDTSNQSGQILALLIIAFAFKSTNFVCGSLLVAAGDLKNLNILLGVTVILNIVANLILIPVSGPYGAALTTLGTQVVVALGMYGLTLRYLGDRSHLRKLLPIVSAFILSVPGIVILDSIYLDIAWYGKFFLLACYVLLATMVARLLSLAELAYFARIIQERVLKNRN